jgi:hypothetical protein
MIANAVSQPGKIVATAQASNGSLANVTGIAGGAMESGFSQADVATWAQKGTGIFEGKPNVPGLRLIANLYPESVHVVVKKGSGIKSVADLKGKRVALDEPGSGTLVNARAILAAYGVTEKDIKPEYIKPNQAGDKMKDGSLDAFFFTGGAPAGAIAELASAGGGIDILPIDGPQAEALKKNSGFFADDLIAADTYKGVGAGEDHRRGCAVGHQRQGRRQPGVRDHQGAVQRRRAEDAGRRPRQGQVHHQGKRRQGRRHPVPPGRREVLQGSRADQVSPPKRLRRLPPGGTASGPAEPVPRRLLGARTCRPLFLLKHPDRP